MKSTALKLVGKTTSLVVAGSVFLSLVFYRDITTVGLVVGSLANGILSKILKRLLNQSRPPRPSPDATDMPTDGGMPSSHAMSLGFIGVYTACCCVRPIICWIPMFSYAATSLVYRVQSRLHTTAQVVVGGLLGSVNGWLWFQYFVSQECPVRQWITTHWLSEEGLLPYPLLLVPLCIGAVTISSVERNLNKLLKLE